MEELFQHKSDLNDEMRVMDKEAVEVDPSQKGKELGSSHGKTIIGALSSGSTSWIRSQNPRIVRVSRAFGGKDRHSKVCTINGLRDRRVRLSVPTAFQLYDLQDRLGLSQPSKVVDWLLDAVKHEIDELPPLPSVPGTNFVHSIHYPRLSAASHDLPSNVERLVRASDDWKTSGSTSKHNLREAITQEHDDECCLHDSRKGSRGQRQERDSHDSGCNLRPSNDMPKWPHPYNGISQEVFRLPAVAEHLFPNSISATPREDEVRKSTTYGSDNEIDEFPFLR